MLNVDTRREYFDAQKQFLSIFWLSVRSAATEVSQNLINIGQKFSAKKSNFSKENTFCNFSVCKIELHVRIMFIRINTG